jgi:cytochrome c oxidase assembly protein subunit 15
MEKNVTTDSTSGNGFITRRHCYLLLTAAVMTYLLITMGGIVCVTESGQGCPDWPGCYGQIIPPMRVDAVIEYMHRVIAALTSPFIIAAALVGWKSRAMRWVSRPPALAVACTFAVVAFGALAVLRGLSPGLAAVDLGLALMTLALMVTASAVAVFRHGNPGLPDRLSFRNSFARLTLWTLIPVFVVLVSGVLVAEGGSSVRCLGWPLLSGQWVPRDFHAWLQMARRLMAGMASILVVAVVVQAWRTQRRHAAILRAATIVGVLLLAEATIETLVLTRGFTVFLLVMSVATVAALWAWLVALAVLAGVEGAGTQTGLPN